MQPADVYFLVVGVATSGFGVWLCFRAERFVRWGRRNWERQGVVAHRDDYTPSRGTVWAVRIAGAALAAASILLTVVPAINASF